jgi:prophage DNA circulation protein
MKTMLCLIVLLTLSSVAFAGVKDKILAPANALGEYVSKVVKGTNETLKNTVAGASNAASGFVNATADLGEDTYRAVTVQPKE